jgi:dGTPase
MSDRICDIFLEREKSTLSEFAFLTSMTKGRDHPNAPCITRTEFQRDRDRIIHCKSFRRLTHKTQVFLSPEDEHYRTRLTHTLEVSQIARIIARALRLNEDLTEAAALGHDLGHTPFGHAGERALQGCYDKSFTHYKQSVRVVEKLENNGEGLNLTYEVRDGILNHSGTNMASTLEGRIIKFADRIAYINHDIDDAIRAKILRYDDIPAHLRDILGQTHSERINCMVSSVIKASEGHNYIAMTDDVGCAMTQLRDFLFVAVYTNPIAKKEEGKSEALVYRLFEHYCKNVDSMPELYRRIAEQEGHERAAADYIASMTDRYAIEKYSELYVPKVWRGASE